MDSPSIDKNRTKGVRKRNPLFSFNTSKQRSLITTIRCKCDVTIVKKHNVNIRFQAAIEEIL